MLPTFEKFRDDLDDAQEKRERLIKTSREVTANAKKIIFLLHRLVSVEEEDAETSHTKAVKQAKRKLHEINAHFARMAPDLAGEEFWRHWRSVSPGLQEYIEALSFAHYLEFGTLASYRDVQTAMTDDNGVPYFTLPLSDYLLGISDLTGELMRFAIVAITRKEGIFQARQVCTFVRNCYADLEKFSPHVRENSPNAPGVGRPACGPTPHIQSLGAHRLPRAAVYAVVVRGAEYRGKRDDIADEIVRRYVSGLDQAFSVSRDRGGRGGGADGNDDQEDE